MDIKKLFNKTFLISIATIIAGCTLVGPKYPTSMDDMQASLKTGIAIDKSFSRSPRVLPTSVREAMLPPLRKHEHAVNQFSEKRFDIAADNMPARVFFTSLVDGTHYNMVVDPAIDGTITLSLKNVTIHEAMAAVRDVYGYQYRRTSYGYEVSPPTLASQLFNVNYLDVKRSGKSTTEIASGQISDKVGTVSVGGSSSTGAPTAAVSSTSQVVSSSVVNTTSEVNFWHDLEITLKNMVPAEKGRSVTLNPQAGVVIVHAFPHELHQVARYLDRIQSNLQRQIIIEAKILEVRLDDGFDAGIDWSLFGNPLNGDALFSQSGNGPNNTGLSGSGAFGQTALSNFDPIFTINYKGSFRTLMRFLQTQGNVQVLSSPRISTVNNQKAVIKVGQDQFFVTGVSTTNTLVGTNTLPSQNVDLTPFFSGITLDVTPQISRDGSVILHIHPSVSVVKEQQKTINLGSSGTTTPNILTLPLALSTVRESDNIVRAKNGQVVVIGGLMENVTSENVAGTPVLSRIPFFGFFFRRTNQVSTKTELIILLRPIVVNNRVWTNRLQRAKCELDRHQRYFRMGGLTDDFGNQGEVTDTM